MSDKPACIFTISSLFLNARRIDRDGDEGNPKSILLAFQDITADTHTGERE
ncbi:MAG: hypothetical protein ACSLFH_14365 [Desulfuromonadales bacterium]